MLDHRAARPIGASTWVALAALAAAVVVLLQFMAVLQDAVARGEQRHSLPSQAARVVDHEAVGVVNRIAQPPAQRDSRNTGQALTRI